MPVANPRNGQAYQALLVGGPGAIHRDLTPRFMEEFGIALTHHWESNGNDGKRSFGALPRGTEVVVILTDMIGHGLAQEATRLAKNASLPYALVGRKRSAWVTGLLNLGFEQDPTWRKTLPKSTAPVTPEPEPEKTVVAPATELKPTTESPVSIVETPKSPGDFNDARLAVAGFLAAEGAMSMSTILAKLGGRFSTQELRVATANLLNERWVFERPDRRLDLVSGRVGEFKGNPKKILSRPLDGRLDAVPLKQAVLQEFIGKHGTADLVFDAPSLPGTAVRHGHGYSRDVKSTLDGIEATIVASDGTLHHFQLPWRCIYMVSVNNVSSRAWPECGAPPGRWNNVPINVAFATRPEPTPVSAPPASPATSTPEPAPVPKPAPVAAPPTPPPVDYKFGGREVVEPSTAFLKKTLPDAVFRQLVNRGALTVQRLQQTLKFKAVNIRWALMQLIDAGRVKALDDGYEAVLPKGAPTPSSVDDEENMEDTVENVETVDVEEPSSSFAPEAFRTFCVKYIGALTENVVYMREQLARLSKRQRLVERLMSKIYVDLGGSVESLTELLIDDDDIDEEKKA